MIGILKGMFLTVRHTFRRAVTFQYPKEKRNDLAPRFRGELKLWGMMGVDGWEKVLTEKMPPCMATCPSNMKIREYVGLISEGKYLEAVAKMKEDNPLPAICGYICPHPCEEACRRGDLDEPIAINNLKRFAADYELELRRQGKVPKDKPNITKNKKVAIIGAGPAGLTCAYYLAKTGYPVTIFEKLPVAGGMLVVGIPEYRLPRNIIQEEVNQILDLGVELKLNTSVESIDSLFEQGYEAVFLGIGAHRPLKLGIPGEELQGVIPGEAYLMDISLGKKPKLGKKVAVIGGGNTAIDCARVALREGVKKVSILYRRTPKEMPAHEVEVEDALAEGVDIQYLVAPTKVIGKGKVEGLECVRMELGEKDKSGRRRPVPIEGSEFIVEVDNVLSAISRVPEVGWLEKAGIDIHPRRGVIVTDSLTGETSRPGVFAGGDGSLGADIAIAAIGGGKRAAFSIDAYLSGQDIKAAHQRRTIEAMVKSHFLDEPRVTMPKLSPQKRRDNYALVELGLPEKEALKEGKRCLSCETRTCIGCSICADSCLAEAIKIGVFQDEKVRRIDRWDLYLDRCIFCGICVEVCPTKTLHHTHKYESAQADVFKLIKDKEYLLRDEALISKEGWTLPHNFVSSERLYTSGLPPKEQQKEGDSE